MDKEAVPRKDKSRIDIIYKVEATNSKLRSNKDIKLYCKTHKIKQDPIIFNFSGKHVYSDIVQRDTESEFVTPGISSFLVHRGAKRPQKEEAKKEPVRKSSDVSTLRKLYDEITIQIRCLESLKVDINSYGNLLLPILYKCIPNDLVLRFNRQNFESEVTVTGLLSCIKKEIEAREKTVCFNPSKFTRSEDKRFENFHKNYVPTKKENIFCINTKYHGREKKCATSVLKTTNRKTVICQCQSGTNQYMINTNVRGVKKGSQKSLCIAKWVKCKLCKSQSHLECLCDSHSAAQPECKNKKGNSIGDQPSERSDICESTAERAGLKTVGIEKLKIFTFASNEASVSELKRKKRL
ncbi:uncharacterized protein CEXT_646831 [Caerostris extrusa]|uniref:Uncharacterized protein n=1 Tax=Caerostris extrusa TaxID=172846 RepID=A0AAV4Y0K5_CAEEX|nr:uncharacterized protein CEXT_646831 [Caerostris extrusa]